jgi:prophage regulatory protein
MAVKSLLRLPEVLTRTGLSRSELYRREAVGLFPKRVRLGARCVAWSSDEVDDWITSRIRDSREVVRDA